MSKFARKAAISAAAFATVGSALFGGAAMASDIVNDGGAGGNGGTSTNNCLNVGVPVLSGIAVGGTASAVGAHCTSAANGGAGGAGAIVND